MVSVYNLDVIMCIVLWMRIFFSEVAYSIMTIISKQQCSFPAWLVSLGILLEWHFLICGMGVAVQSSSSSGRWRPCGLGLFFPMCPLQCLLHKEPSRTMPSGWSPDRHHLLPAAPPPQSFLHLWIDCITQGTIDIGQIFFVLDYFSFSYSFMKHEVRFLHYF